MTISVRSRLISSLPRLRRFSAVLAGSRQDGDALLREACNDMLDEAHRYQRGTPFDRWAFSEIYRVWLEGLRAQRQAIGQVRADELLLAGSVGDEATQDVSVYLANLPPQQRSAVLLVYGEAFSYEDAAKVLDTPVETVAARVSRALAGLIDKSAPADGSGCVEANVEPFQPDQKQVTA